MCGRVAQTSGSDFLFERFGVSAQEDLGPRFNVAPTQSLRVVGRADEGLALRHLRWGLVPRFARDRREALRRSSINIRAETALTKPFFAAPLRRRRVIVPVDLFYEWERHSGGPQPWAIGRGDRDVLCLAGAWDRWVDPNDGTEFRGVAVLTVAADAAMAALHHRMPLVLSRDEETVWLDPGLSEADLARLLATERSSTELRRWPVSRAINSAGADGAALITPVPLDVAVSA